MWTERLTEGFAGAPWGEEAVGLRVAGGRYRVEGLSATQAGTLQERFAAALSEAGAPGATTLTVLRDGIVPRPAFRPPRGERALIATEVAVDAIRVEGLRFHGELRWDPGQGGRIWTQETAGVQFRLAFENFFRLAVAYRLLRRGALLLHAAAAAERDVADVFFGRSGAGKSTLSRLRQSEGAVVLSDDMVALELVEGGLHARAVPFAGDLETWSQLDRCYPVRALLGLKQGERHALSPPAGVAESAARLVACSPYVNTDPHRTDQLLDTVASLVGAARVRTLSFARREGLGRFLDVQLNGR